MRGQSSGRLQEHTAFKQHTNSYPLNMQQSQGGRTRAASPYTGPLQARRRRRLIVNILILSVLMVLFAQAPVRAQPETINREGIEYPIPPTSENRMFYLQRTPNTNTIACDLKVDRNGNVDLKSPLTTYWLRYGDSPAGEKKDLNFIQRHFAYGLNIKARGDKKYEFWFVSYKKYHMYLLQTKDGKWRVYGKINDKLTVLGSIFIYIKGGSVWNPHVVYVELRGKDLKTGKQEVQRLTDVKKDPEAGHNKEG